MHLIILLRVKHDIIMSHTPNVSALSSTQTDSAQSIATPTNQVIGLTIISIHDRPKD